MSINKRRPMVVALGTALAIGTGAAQASSLFVASDLGAGYMVASIGDKAGEHACGEGGCGADMKATPAAGSKEAAKKESAEAKAAAAKAAEKAKASEAKPK